MSSNASERLFDKPPADVGHLQDGVVDRMAVYDERPNSPAELERQNELLRQRVKLLESVLNTAPVGIGIALDPSCDTIQVNAGLANMLSIPVGVNASPSGPTGDRLPYRFVRGDAEVPPSELPMHYAAAHGEDAECELDVEMADGRHLTLWQAARPLTDDRGTIIGAVCATTDITERKRETRGTKFLMRASEILAGSLELKTTLENLARQVVPGMADVYWLDLLNDRGALERVTVRVGRPDGGGAQTELFAEPSLDTIPEHPVHDVVRTGVPFFADGRDGPVVRKLTHRPAQLGSLWRLDVTSMIIVPLEARGGILGAMSMVTTGRRRRFDRKDLTVAAELARRAAVAVDTARLIASLEQSREEAQRANRAKSDFLATMSHELRTPLNAIAGYAQLLLLGLRGEITPDQRGDLERISQNQRHLLGLINSVLNFTKLDAGEVPYHLTRISIDDVLAGVEPIIAPQMQAKGIRYRHERLDTPLTILADEDKVRQIVLNLLSNAVKFTPPGGAVTVYGRDDGMHRSIVVSDTGVGIPHNKLHRVFEPFTQVDRTLSTPHEGVGLGLSISRDLARGMGGEIGVQSEPGRGTTFVVTLPNG